MTTVKITVSPALGGFFRFIGDQSAHSDSVDLDETLEKIAKFNSEHPHQIFDIGELLADCGVLSRSPTRPSSEAGTDIEQIRQQLEERKYQESIRGLVKGARLISQGIQEEVQEMKEGYLVVMSFFMSFIGSILFGYFATEIFLGWRREYCVFAGVTCAAATLGVEAMLWVIRDEKKRLKIKNR